MESAHWILYWYLQGIGRRFSTIVCKKADIDMNKRAGELADEDVSRRTFILLWFIVAVVLQIIAFPAV